MPALTVRFRARAAADVDDAADHHQREAVALDFIESLERCVRQLGRSPHIGSLRFSYELDIPELRVLGTRRFPYLVTPGDTQEVGAGCTPPSHLAAELRAA